MALIGEVRMDKCQLAVAATATPSDAKAYCQTRTTQERLAALELMRQTIYGYDPDTTRLQRVLDVTHCP